MNKKKKITVILLPLFILISFFALKFWAQEECVEYLGGVFTENFNTEDYKDMGNTSIAYWPPGPISLNWLGGQFEVTEALGMGGKIFICDQGDFDADGYPDVIGYDITDDENRKLLLVRNYWDDANEDGIDDDGVILYIDDTEVYEDGFTGECGAMAVGDYNGDGLLDFFFIINDNDDHFYDNYMAAMYINVGTATDPDFYPHGSSPNLDFTSRFIADNIFGSRWTAKHVDSVDIDQDGDTDILLVHDDTIYLIRNPGPSSFSLDNFQISELNYDQKPGFPIATDEDYGGSTVESADFDNDGDPDIVSGTVEDVPYLVYYDNDGTGYFTRHEIPIPNPVCTGATTTNAGDFDQDGLIDIFGSVDKWQSGNDARMYLFENNGLAEGEGLPIDFEFKCLNDCEVVTPDPYDTDFGTVLDIDQDGDKDFIFADANDSGNYYMAENEVANVYTTYGEAWSTNISGGLDPNLYAITKAEITNLQMRTRGSSKVGLKVELYLSNNDGKNWEFFQSFEENNIHNYNDLPVHTFIHFGSKLRWKAIVSAPEDPMVEYTGASFDTPLIDEITFEYTLVDRREYSRTSVVVTNVEEDDQKKKYLLASTFYFPSWEGHLRAYDLSGMTPESTSYSVLRTVSRPDLSETSGREVVPSGVEIVWDAGELLDARSAASRTVYTATPVDSVLARVDFTASNVDTLGPILQDVNNDNEGLINYVRGEGREWKLGDSNHSNPVVVSPPDGAATQMGDGYQDFMNTWVDRRKVVYVGANDGMLHCFDVLTGEELWGFIPYNLLPKLKNMWAVE
ncbi:MAG: hypothetical protein GQ476_03870, partial [Candidatus Aminicenantes bacterium]|nr:hypothetical protein [Candidatus Aminicenantes bacterium]